MLKDSEWEDIVFKKPVSDEESRLLRAIDRYLEQNEDKDLENFINNIWLPNVNQILKERTV